MERKISVIENNNNIKLLVYETAKENKNETAIKFAKYNEIAHLLDADFEEDNYIRGIYDITECTPIMDSISKYPGRDEVFNLIKKLVYVLTELRGSFICEPDLYLNKDYIYIDRNSKLIRFVVAPEIQSDKNSIVSLIEDILISTSWKRIEIKSYLNVLGRAIKKDNITYDEIIDVINSELEKPVQFQTVESPASEKVKNINSNAVREEVRLVEEVAESSYKDEDAEGSGMTGELEGDNKMPNEQSAPMSPVPPVQQSAPMPPVPPVQQSAPMPPVPPVQQSAPMPPVPPVQQSAPMSPVPPVQQSAPMPLVSQAQQYGYDESDDESHFGETTVLGMSSQPMVFPSLTRIKTQEKIVINKSEFYIGKDPSRVDYCVFDNSAVSRVHAKIVCKNGEFFVMDNHSTNHVYVNGMLIDANVEIRLTHGARVRFGDEDFEFRFQ